MYVQTQTIQHNNTYLKTYLGMLYKTNLALRNLVNNFNNWLFLVKTHSVLIYEKCLV